MAFVLGIVIGIIFSGIPWCIYSETCTYAWLAKEHIDGVENPAWKRAIIDAKARKEKADLEAR